MYFEIFVAVLSLFLVATMPKPKSNPPATFEQVTAPTAEEGRPIPVVFGSPYLEGPNVVWFGHFRTQEIKA